MKRIYEDQNGVVVNLDVSKKIGRSFESGGLSWIFGKQIAISNGDI